MTAFLGRAEYIGTEYTSFSWILANQGISQKLAVIQIATSHAVLLKEISHTMLTITDGFGVYSVVLMTTRGEMANN